LGATDAGLIIGIVAEKVGIQQQCGVLQSCRIAEIKIGKYLELDRG